MIKIVYYKFQNGELVPFEEKVPATEWPGQMVWIDIQTDDAGEGVAFLGAAGYSKEVQERVSQSGSHNQPQKIGNDIIWDIVISDEKDVYASKCITLILQKTFCITVAPPSSTLMDKTRTLISRSKDFEFSALALVKMITAQILATGYQNMNQAKHRLVETVNTLDESPEDLSPADVMSCKRHVGQLADIIEDQFTEFGFVSSLLWGDRSSQDTDAFKTVVNGFGPLNKAMGRLEEKASTIHDQYLLIQQERSTRRINLLTIIQAVFVPLTFVAGVYGMNFESMPELKWIYGYPAVWGLFVGMAVFLMVYFYRKGWFE